MTEITKFTQPDVSPTYFIEFLEFLDKQDEINRARAELNKRLKPHAGEKVLDLGCGIGGAASAIADETGPTGLVAGIDISAALIEVARRKAGNRAGMEFKTADASAIPYPDGFFDAARTERVFLYLPDRLAVLREIKRVVKAGGRVCLMDTEIDSIAIYSANRALARKMTSLVAATMPNPNSGRELPVLAKQAGLKSIEIDTFALATPHEFFLRSIASSLSKAAEEGAVPRSEVEEFLAEQEALNAKGDFFQAWLFVLVTGTV
jgi:ubiquinone/menaquinone biosynthesis C-methylase UbiE